MGENKILLENEISLEEVEEDGKIIEGIVDGIGYKVKRIGNGAYNYSIGDCDLETRTSISEKIEGTVKIILNKQRTEQEKEQSENNRIKLLLILENNKEWGEFKNKDLSGDSIKSRIQNQVINGISCILNGETLDSFISRMGHEAGNIKIEIEEKIKEFIEPELLK